MQNVLFCFFRNNLRIQHLDIYCFQPFNNYSLLLRIYSAGQTTGCNFRKINMIKYLHSSIGITGFKKQK